MRESNGIKASMLLLLLGCSGQSTVTGTVRTVDGQTVSGAQVTIETKRAVTDANGVFRIANVTSPYDVSVVVPLAQLGTLYQGLNRSDPNLILFGPSPELLNTGSLGGSLSGGNAAASGSLFTEVVWASPETVATGYSASQTYQLEISWSGPETTTGNLHALQVLYDASSHRASYNYGAKTGVAVVRGSAEAGVDIPLVNVGTAQRSGTISVPAGFAVDATGMTLAFADGAEFDMGGNSTSSEFAYQTPTGTGGTINLSADAIAAAGGQSGVVRYGLAPDATGVSLEVRVPAHQGLPLDGGTDVTAETDFTWTPFEGGLHVVVFAPSQYDGNPTYYVVTRATTTRLPEELALPGGVRYSWSVWGYAPFDSVDAFVGPNVLRYGLHGLVPRDASVLYESVSGYRTFETPRVR